MKPRFHLKILGQSLAFQAGSVLSCEYRVEIPKKLLEVSGQADSTEMAESSPSVLREISGIETSVLWYTSGKGDEDIGVHFFERREKRLATPELLNQTQRFHTKLPSTPVSYRGALVQICWVVRVRLFLSDGSSFTEERPFRLIANSDA